MPTLTDRQRAFCHNLAEGMTGAEAARAAGYKNAGRQAYQLLEKPHIDAYLTQLRDEARTNAVLTLTELQEWWSSAVRGEHPDAEYRDRQKASEMLAKSHGGFTDKHEHLIRRDPREMSDDELDQAVVDAGLTD